MSERRGFTLIEVVLSLVILAMAMAVVFSMLRLAHRAEEKGSARLEDDQRAIVLADRLTWLLAGTYPYRVFDKEEEKDVLIFSGDSESLEFVTTSVDRYSEDLADLPGLKHVRLWLTSGGLRADERLFYMEDAEFGEYVLEPNAVDLAMEYLDEDPETGVNSWEGSWDSKSKGYLPVAVSLEVGLELGEHEVQVPRVVVRLPVGGPRGVVKLPVK